MALNSVSSIPELNVAFESGFDDNGTQAWPWAPFSPIPDLNGAFKSGIEKNGTQAWP